MTTIAFVGCAHIHTPGFIGAIKKRPDIRVKSLWDPNPVVAEKRAAELGATVVPDDKVIWKDKDITAVVITSETTDHQRLVLAAAKAGKHIFAEKPLGMGSADGYKMAAAIGKAGVIFSTGYFQRGLPTNQFLKQEIAKGTFGKVTRVRGSNCHSGALGGWFDAKPDSPWEDWRWMADPKRSGVGGFGDLGTHSLDILLWIMGDVAKATGCVDVGTNRYDGCDELGEGLMRFEGGAIGTLAAGWDDVANPVHLIVSGTKAHAAVIDGELFFTCANVEGADGKTPWTKLPEARNAGFEGYLDAIEGKGNPELVTAMEAAYRSAVMEAIYAGSKKGKWIEPKKAPTGK